MRHLLLFLGLPLLLLTALSLVPSEAWWAQLLAFPRVQLGVGLALVLLAWLPLRRPRARRDSLYAAALVLGMAAQAWWILPYTALHPAQPPTVPRCAEADRLRLLVANLQEHNRRAEAFLGLVRAMEPDVVLALEGDAWWDARLAAGLSEAFPHAIHRPRNNGYGLHLFSRLPVAGAEVLFLEVDDRPSLHVTLRLRSGLALRLHGMHPVPPHLDRTGEARADALLQVARMIAREGMPAVLAGDLNAVGWGELMRRVRQEAALLDPRIGRGILPTFSAENPVLRWPIDHVLHTAEFGLVALARGPYFGSDHFPILAELCAIGPGTEAVTPAPS